jgi:phosphatidylglycerol:prolipoprotein diacylglycerol transferase
LAIAQVVGQWGNLINQEAFGYPTNVSWGIYIDYADRPIGYEQFDFFHPVFLYASLWNLVIFIVLIGLAWYQRKTQNLQSGYIFLLNIILYAAGRLAMEGLRLDSELLGGFRLAQIMGIIDIVISLWLLNYRHKHYGGI